MANKRKRSGCLITLVVITLIISGIIIAAINIPIRYMGLGDVKMGDKTANELGLGDLTVVELIDALKDIQNPPKENDIINNPIKEDNNKFIDENLGASVPSTDDGKPDYGGLFNENNPIKYPQQIEIKYTDADLAALLANVFNQALDDNNITAQMGDLNLVIRQLTIKKNNETTATVTLLFSVDISSFKNEIKAMVPFINLPDVMYITISNNITVNNLGKVVTHSVGSIGINNMMPSVAKVLLNVLFAQAGGGVDSDLICSEAGNQFNNLINNLGLVTTNDNIKDGSITVLTYTD